MFHRIVVPVDDTERSQQSATLATHLAKQFGATVLVVHVKPFTTGSQDIVAAMHAVEVVAEKVRRAGVACDALLDLDKTVEGIVATAKYQDSDLIVLAPHHRSWLKALRHPSVTEEMMAQSPAPLLIWPEGMPPEAAASVLESPASTVMVPLDGSELAEQALPYATALAERMGRALLLVRVVPPVVVPTMSPQTIHVEESVHEQEQTSARAYMRQVRERIAAQSSVAVQSIILAGQPASELLQVAESHPDSVLVMTTHGRGRAGRAWFGSVAADLAHQATIPMFVLRPSETSAQTDTSREDAWAAHI